MSDRTNIMWLSNFLADCPKCWQNFVKNVNPDSYIEEEIFQARLRDHNITYYGRYKADNLKDESKNRMMVIFATADDLLAFRIKWG